MVVCGLQLCQLTHCGGGGCHYNTQQVSFYLAVESLHRVVNPVRIVGPRLLEVSLGGLAVNLVGAVAFKSTGSWLGRHAAHTQTPSGTAGRVC